MSMQRIGERRFVFVLTNTGEETLEGRNIEVRARSLADALDKGDCWGELTKRGIVATLIGERTGLYSSSRKFHPLAPLADLPWDIVQNERFVGTTLVDGFSVDAEQARVALLAQRYAEAEERGFGNFSDEAFDQAGGW